jgi:RNA polymerase sigma factor (sigma-70 family)
MAGLLTAQTIEKSPGRGFTDFYKDNYPIMYRLAKSITGCPEDAQDVVHLVFSRILHRDFTASFLKNPKGYLCRAAVNQALLLVKARGRHSFTDDNVEYLPDTKGVAPDDDTLQRLREAMAKLKPQTVQMLVLRYQENMDEEAIAELMSKSRSTVAVTLFRARMRIRKMMRNSGKEKHHETR